MENGFVMVNMAGAEHVYDEQGHDGHLADIDEFVDSLESVLWPLNTYMHDNPELGFQEKKAHHLLTEFYQSRDGWRVTRSAYGMETAWKAEHGNTRLSPVVSFNAEMDALPGLGHACGHNLIAMVSVAASIATAEILHRHNLPGGVVVLGTPAEEGGGGGKIKCLEAGAYRDVDVSMISHPGLFNNSPLVRTTAYVHLDVAYRGRAAHSANSPWMGVNALDAIVVAYNAISVLRQQTRPDDVISLQITNGGSRPNVIHEHSAGVAVLRCASTSRLVELQRKVEACFRAGAEATGAEVKIDVVPGYKDHVPNRVLADSFAKFWTSLPDAPRPHLPPPGQFTWVKASTDQGNLSYALPSMNVSFAIPPGLKSGPPHTPDFEKASGTREAFKRAMRVAKVMAATAVAVCTTPDLLKEAQQQWRRDMDEGLEATGASNPTQTMPL